MTFMANFFKSSNSSLGKRSTAQDVVKHLNINENLASYVPKFNAEQVAEIGVPEGPLTESSSVALVTGGNAGIGAVAVKTFAMLGMKVILCARSIDSAEKVIEDLPDYCQNAVTIQELDLADLSSIEKAVFVIKNKYKGIDLVLQNAGVMAIEERTTTKQGFEMQFGTNHIGHHMLTRLLLPIMRENSRIVTVSSTAQQLGDATKGWDAYLEGDGSYTPWGAYGNSKLANCMFAKILQDKLDESGRTDVKSVSLHPGIVFTGLWKHSSSILKPFAMLMPDYKNVEQGAATSIYCALAKNITGGAYHKDCAETAPSDPVLDAKLREALWDYTELQIMTKGYGLPKMLGKPAEVIIESVKQQAAEFAA